MPRAGGQEEFTNKGAANWLRWNETPTKTTDRFTVEIDIKDNDCPSTAGAVAETEESFRAAAASVADILSMTGHGGLVGTGYAE
ncbi:hypothetical protein MN608_02908 [Microdochium nivale]|nr:hypothetical protein MN608_02908 [Microdochium nivale]